jgi:hypothetical protein
MKNVRTISLEDIDNFIVITDGLPLIVSTRNGQCKNASDTSPAYTIKHAMQWLTNLF